MLEGTLTLENVRDELRHDLHNLDSTKFPMGKTGASVGQLAFEMLKYEKHNAVAEITCVRGCCKHGRDESSLLQWK